MGERERKSVCVCERERESFDIKYTQRDERKDRKADEKIATERERLDITRKRSRMR